MKVTHNTGSEPQSKVFGRPERKGTWEAFNQGVDVSRPTVDAMTPKGAPFGTSQAPFREVRALGEDLSKTAILRGDLGFWNGSPYILDVSVIRFPSNGTWPLSQGFWRHFVAFDGARSSAAKAFHNPFTRNWEFRGEPGVSVRGPLWEANLLLVTVSPLTEEIAEGSHLSLWVRIEFLGFRGKSPILASLKRAPFHDPFTKSAAVSGPLSVGGTCKPSSLRTTGTSRNLQPWESQ
jgi:hypothetical protein